jgi:thiamine biosynthesis lipoprotein
VIDGRHVFQTMGTAASLSFADSAAEPVDLAVLHSIFESFDARYSLYRPDSEISRLARGEVALPDTSSEFRATYVTAIDWRARTNGDFSPHRPDGVLDLSGVVKALAMDRAGEELRGAGASDWCLNVGGDILVSGRKTVGEDWTVGIVDPNDRSALLTSVELHDSRRACATSGSAERGDHIWTTGGEPAHFVQATVLADDIVTADVLATAIVSGGPRALDQICASWDIDAMTVDCDGEIRMTPHFQAH